jgi:hypothetical protein
MNSVNKDILKKLFGSKDFLTNRVSINDLREKEYSGGVLSEKEKLAIFNYERFRLSELNKYVNSSKFNEVYQLLQIMANLRPWEDFLDEKYVVKEK